MTPTRLNSVVHEYEKTCLHNLAIDKPFGIDFGELALKKRESIHG